MENSPKKKNTFFYNIAFLVLSAAILVFLWNAPPESTVKIPYDKNHKGFYEMPKKEAEKHCEECHGIGKAFPLPKDHPPKFRCLFCHKKESIKSK